MTEPLIYSVGTQVVVQRETYHVNRRVAHPAGSVGVIVRSPIDRTHAYRVKFNDGFEANCAPRTVDEVVRLQTAIISEAAANPSSIESERACHLSLRDRFACLRIGG